MIKKAVIGAVGAAALGTFVFGTSALSYMRTGVSEVREAVRSEVPLDFEIARAKQEIENIAPEIERCMHVIAEQQYDVEQREAEIARRTDELNGQKQAILALRQDLDAKRDVYVYASRRYSADDVREDLARRFDRFKTSEETLGRDQQIVEARRKALAANEEKLDNMLAVKKDLAVKIENLEARLNAVQASEAISDIQIDDSQLARAKQLIRDLDKKIGTRETLLSNEGRFTGGIPVELDQQDKEATENVEEQVDAYFSGEQHTQPVTDLPEA
jgi:peptidoglycan hydrolase CwlO-like protein